ncbi:LytTR family DNA-binding domain-containing protein [Telluribacter sp. SYSU D00476]|uniref:LytR/AlgR family response regulator transcription factor n=1 Tax=Telluribacter sp. SYSU D00476 TaxID=2811430 RepID=UPI001FF6901B|nr:LytTR family DNA-binding domain-containing protein [Telluribacter sp. SYSU D00476]
MKNNNYLNRLKYLLIPLQALVFLQVGRPLPLWDYLGHRDFYFDLIFALIIGSIIWTYIQYSYQLLDRTLPWGTHFTRRLVCQALLSGFLPIFLLLALYVGYMELYYAESFRLEKSLIFQVDLLLGTLLILIQNLVFVIATLIHKYLKSSAPEPLGVPMDLPEENQPPAWASSKLLVGNGSKYTLLDRDEMQFIKLQNGVSVAYLKDGTSSVLNTPLNSLDETLPDYFFRVNRNTIVNLKEVKGFEAEKSGKLILRLHAESAEEIIVSQNRSVDFKNKLVTI